MATSLEIEELDMIFRDSPPARQQKKKRLQKKQNQDSQEPEISQQYAALSRTERLKLLLTEQEMSAGDQNNQKNQQTQDLIIIDDQNDVPDGMSNNGKLEQAQILEDDVVILNDKPEQKQKKQPKQKKPKKEVINNQDLLTKMQQNSLFTMEEGAEDDHENNQKEIITGLEFIKEKKQRVKKPAQQQRNVIKTNNKFFKEISTNHSVPSLEPQANQCENLEAPMEFNLPEMDNQLVFSHKKERVKDLGEVKSKFNKLEQKLAPKRQSSNVISSTIEEGSQNNPDFFMSRPFSNKEEIQQLLQNAVPNQSKDFLQENLQTEVQLYQKKRQDHTINNTLFFRSILSTKESLLAKSNQNSGEKTQKNKPVLGKVHSREDFFQQLKANRYSKKFRNTTSHQPRFNQTDFSQLMRTSSRQQQKIQEGDELTSHDDEQSKDIFIIDDLSKVDLSKGNLTKNPNNDELQADQNKLALENLGQSVNQDNISTEVANKANNQQPGNIVSFSEAEFLKSNVNDAQFPESEMQTPFQTEAQLQRLQIVQIGGKSRTRSESVAKLTEPEANGTDKESEGEEAEQLDPKEKERRIRRLIAEENGEPFESSSSEIEDQNDSDNDQFENDSDQENNSGQGIHSCSFEIDFEKSEIENDQQEGRLKKLKKKSSLMREKDRKKQEKINLRLERAQRIEERRKKLENDPEMQNVLRDIIEEEAELGSENEEHDDVVKPVDRNEELKELGVQKLSELDQDLEGLIQNQPEEYDQDNEDLAKLKFIQDQNKQEKEDLQKVMRGEFVKGTLKRGFDWEEQLNDDGRERQRQQRIDEILKQNEREEEFNQENDQNQNNLQKNPDNFLIFDEQKLIQQKQNELLIRKEISKLKEQNKNTFDALDEIKMIDPVLINQTEPPKDYSVFQQNVKSVYEKLHQIKHMNQKSMLGMIKSTQSVSAFNAKAIDEKSISQNPFQVEESNSMRIFYNEDSQNKQLSNHAAQKGKTGAQQGTIKNSGANTFAGLLKQNGLGGAQQKNQSCLNNLYKNNTLAKSPSKAMIFKKK